jgi:hypothetical protein
MSVEFEDRIFRQLIQNSPDALDAWLRSMAHDINGDVVQSFGSGVSAPGDPPGVDTGALRASMHVEKVENLHYVVADGVEYGVYLEMGTETMAPRPFMNPVIEEWQGSKVEQSAKNAGLLNG